MTRRKKKTHTEIQKKEEDAYRNTQERRRRIQKYTRKKKTHTEIHKKEKDAYRNTKDRKHIFGTINKLILYAGQQIRRK